MTLAIHAVQPSAVPCYGNPAVFYGSAEVTAQSRHLATVFTISGDVDASNAEALSARVNRLVLPGTGVVVDLSGVTSFAVDGALLIGRIDEACRAAGVDWALVASPVVTKRLAATDALYPFALSVPEALHRFADRIGARRRVLLPLLTKSA